MQNIDRGISDQINNNRKNRKKNSLNILKVRLINTEKNKLGRINKAIHDITNKRLCTSFNIN